MNSFETNLNAKILALISHKLKTPLSIINGYAEAILLQQKKEKLSPFATKSLEEIFKQGKQMSFLVEKLFVFNKVSTIKADQICKQSIPLKAFIKECASKAISQEGDTPNSLALEESSTRQGTYIEIDCPEQLAISADKEMLFWCIHELLCNAIKFNNKIEKLIKVQAVNHGSTISISVRDCGVGISNQEINKIYDPFYQVDDYFTGQISGWGLGLTVVKQIMELHKGTIGVVSDRGIGSIFTVNFPVL